MPTEVLSFVKVRASYGVTGDQEIGDFQHTSFYTPSKYNGQATLVPRNLADPNLSWQQNQSFNIGVDVELLKGRISATADYFVADHTRLLYDQPIAGTTGFNSVTVNSGQIQDSGFELAIRSFNIKGGDFKWNTSFNISFLKNEIKQLSNDAILVNAYSDITETHVLKVGQSLGTFWGLKYLGVNSQTGKAMYDDLNHDGIIDQRDAQVIGKARPDFYGGITNNFTYKDFDLSIAMQFSVGNQVYNLTRSVTNTLGWSNGGGLTSVYANSTADALNYWKQPGDNAAYPKPSYFDKPFVAENSSAFVEDGSFLRFRTINLGYTIRPKVGAKSGFRSLRVFAQVQNAFIITKYTGYDPEVSATGGSNDRTAGLDYFTYPHPRTFTFGFNVGF